MIDKLEENVPKGNNDLEAEAEVAKVSLKLNCLDLEEVSDDENPEQEAGKDLEDGDEDIIKGLSEMALGKQDVKLDETNMYLAKGPMFRRNEVSNRAAPYAVESLNVKPSGNGNERIPYLPDTNVAHPNDEYVKNMDQFYNSKSALAEPRLFMRKSNRELHSLSMAAHVTLNLSERKIGIQLPRILVPEDVHIDQGHVEIMLQPNSREQRYVSGKARVEESNDDPDSKKVIFVEPQFLELSPFIICGLTSVEYLLEGVSEEDIQNAVGLVNRQDSFDLLKTYGPNKDTMLMALCCKKDDTPMIRAQVYALCSRILSMTDSSYRQNVVLKNDSGLSALDYTTVTNNSRVAVFLAELFYVLGQDILGRDGSGNTIIHVMARKGDSVSSCLEALFMLRFRHGAGGKVYNSNLVNSKNFLPIHIAAMSLKCPQKTLRILRQDYEHSLDCRTSDGSLPLHLACQYSSDPNLVVMIISWNKNPTVDERRNDGFTPLHLVAARNEEKDVKVGLIPLEENPQLQMLQVLLENGANKNVTVENYKPVDLLKPTRTQATGLLRMNTCMRKADVRNPMMNYYADSPNSLVSGSPSGDHSPIASNRSPSFGFYNSDIDSSPNVANQWQSSPYKYDYSPSAHVGSVSSGVESHYSDESDEDNNGGPDIDAIAQVLIGHPTIQAAIEAATRLE